MDKDKNRIYRSNNVVQLPCVTRHKIPANTVLEAAIDELEEVIVFGYDKSGAEYFASSLSDGGDVLWMLERAKQKLMKLCYPEENE